MNILGIYENKKFSTNNRGDDTYRSINMNVNATTKRPASDYINYKRICAAAGSYMYFQGKCEEVVDG